MSALPPKADIALAGRDVCFVPKANIGLFDHLVATHLCPCIIEGGLLTGTSSAGHKA